VRFSAVLTNQGQLASPAGVQHDITFFIDEDEVVWSDNVTASLAPGASRTQSSNGGPTVATATGLWTATGGTHTIRATANTQGRIAESNTGNNSASTTMTVSAAAGQPTLPSPANLSVGTPASTILGWGNAGHLFQSQATYTLWTGRGWNAQAGSPNYIYGYGGAQRFRGTTAPAGSNDEWTYQRALEGVSGTVAAMIAGGQLERGLGFYLREGSHASGGDNRPVFVPNPYDTAAWTTVIAEWASIAAFIQHANMTCLTWDSETNSFSWDPTLYTGNTHTEAQNRARFVAIGRELAIALWTACPALKIFWYSAYQPGGWNSKIQQVANGQPATVHDNLDWDLCQGLLEGMAAVNATGSITIADATFFRPAYNFLNGANNRAAYQVNSFGTRAYVSRKWSATAWDYACKGAGHFFQAGFVWISDNHDDSFYLNTVPSSTTWSTMHMDARLYSEGGTHIEYTSGFDNNGQIWSGNPRYAEAISIAGTQAASSTSTISTPVPTVSSLAANATTNVITCVCTHPYGIYSVKVYNGSTFNPATPELSYLGAAQMTWNENGGSYTTNYDASYQTATYAPSGGIAPAQWFVVKVTSPKGDYKYQTVQGV
jgi:hypothetical protein